MMKNRNPLNNKLWQAVRSCRTREVERHLDAGADVNIRDEKGTTLLIKAAAWGNDLHLVRLLLLRGADIHAEDDSGWSALDWAVFFWEDDPEFKREVVRLLIEKGALPESAMLLAVSEGQLAVVELFLDSGAAVNFCDYMTALMEAAFEGQEEIVGLLISRGADVNLTNDDGKTAQDYARECGNEEIVKMLEEK